MAKIGVQVSGYVTLNDKPKEQEKPKDKKDEKKEKNKSKAGE